MILNNRQTAVLYELLDNDEYLSYSYLCGKFFATEKTIRTDIAKLNDFFAEQDIRIILTKGKGYKLICSDENRKNLKINFNYRYSNAEDIIQTYNTRDLHIHNMLARGPVRIEDIALELATNTKNVSNDLRNIRTTLNKYGVRLISKPYTGLQMEGNEINIRSALIDSASFMASLSIENLFYDGAAIFNVDQKQLKELAESLLKMSQQDRIPLSQVSLIKLTVAFVIAKIRFENGNHVQINEEGKELVRNFCYYSNYNGILTKLKKDNDFLNDENEREYLLSYAMLLSDYEDKKLVDSLSEEIKTEALQLENDFLEMLENEHICVDDDEHYFSRRMYYLCIELVIRKKLHFIETELSNTFRTIVGKSPLCCCIGSFLYQKANEYAGFEMGEYVLIRLVLLIYSGIRYVNRTDLLCRVALFSPYHKNICNTIVDRIEYHCSNFISGIDILTTEDIGDTDLSKYSLLLYFEDYEPIGLVQKIEKMKISFYFVQKDIDNIYSKLSVMSRSYLNAFGSLKKTDISDTDVSIQTDEDIRNYIIQLCKNDRQLLNQARILSNSKLLINDNTLCIFLFTDRDSLRNTRLIKLKKPMMYQNKKFSFLFISIINAHNDLRNLKTSESVVRMLVDRISKYGIDEKEDVEDYYEYYIRERVH